MARSDCSGLLCSVLASQVFQASNEQLTHSPIQQIQLLVIREELYGDSLFSDEMAAYEIFAHHNPARFDSAGEEIPRRRCDVHGLYVSEARGCVKHFLETCMEKGLREVKVVTGKGIHSEGGEAKLKPAILEFLKENCHSLAMLLVSPSVWQATLSQSLALCMGTHLACCTTTPNAVA